MISLDLGKQVGMSDFISTGSLGLDIALGGGYRKGRIVELSGDYSSYKTSFALHTVAQAQKLGKVLWLDSASDFNPDHARLAGVNTRKLMVSFPQDANQAIHIMMHAAGDYALVVLDTASGLDCEAPYSTIEDWFTWLRADLNLHSTALFINNLTLRSDNYFGQGVRAWATQQISMHPETGYGRVKAVVRKNNGSPPPRHENLLRFRPDGSFDAEFELIKLGLESGVLQKRGSWIYSDTLQIGQGVDDAAQAIREGRVSNNHAAVSIMAALR